MKYSIVLILFSFILIIPSCDQNFTKNITVSEPDVYHMDNISSASGVEYINNKLYIIGDDSPYIYELDMDLNILRKTQLSSVDSTVYGRVPGDIKADFECIGKFNDQELIVISSGSYRDKRDTAYIINPDILKVSYKKNIRELFEIIKKKANLPTGNEINIEGIAISEQSVFMFHRGNISQNLIVEVNKGDFLNWFKNKSSIPEVTVHQFQLPAYEGVNSGFSGASIAPDKNGIIFTASMEDTKSEVADGEILGSFIGYIKISDISNGKYIYTLLKQDNSTYQTKLEGICSNNTDSNVQIITVVDNDNGTSDIIKFQLNIQ